MATSSERSPPPFPDTEDQELDNEELTAQDSDDGEDIFLGSDNPLETKMDPVEPEPFITKPPSDPVDQPIIDLLTDANDVSQLANVASNPTANQIASELIDAAELTKDTSEEPTVTPEPASGISEVSGNIFESPNEPTDTIAPIKEKTEEASPVPEVTSEIPVLPADILEKPNELTDTIELMKPETEEPSKNSGAASDSAVVSEDIFEKPNEPSEVVELTKEEVEEPMDHTHPPSESALVSEEKLENPNEPSDVVELTKELPPSVGADAELSENMTEVPSEQIVIDNSVNDASSAPVLDIFSESISTTVQPTKTDIIDPLSDLLMETPVNEKTTLVVNKTSELTKDLFEDEPSDLFDESLLKTSTKKDSPVEPQRDLFEDEPSDLFTEPLMNPSKLEASRFNEPDEDLFKEPTSTKSLNVTFNEVPVEKHIEARAGAISGPLSDNYMEEPSDIFAEEGLATTPITVNTSSAKTNGVHSDEESDIFAEATVELSLDSPRNNRKNKEVAAASVSPLAVSSTISKPQSVTPEELEEEESGDTFDINISITQPEKVGDGMNAYMGYQVSTQTTLTMFRSKTFTVRRRFSDFLGLYEKLSEKHAQNGYIVPPPPEKSILGMTKVKVGKEDTSSAEFTEKRRASLERYLQRVVCHPSLLQDPDVREFLEREELPRAVSTQALSGAGFLKMISRATDAVSKMTIKMNESDVWFEDKLQEVESEDQQLRKLHALVESLVTHRKELSVNTAGFAKSVAMLGSSEDNTALSRALSQLAEVEDKMEQLHQEQASNDSFTFAEMLADYIRLLGSVRGSFDQRMKAWQRWQDAQNMLQKKRETEAKLLWANKPDKLQQAKEEIAEWEGKVTQYERDFDRVSATVRKEVLRFEKEKARDFKRLVVKYLEALLQSQQQLIKYWEAFLPEAKAIA